MDNPGHRLGRHSADQDLWAHASSPGSLQAAVDAAASVDCARVHLSEGVHVLTAPLVLGRRHSGTRFVGHGAAIISGGLSVGVPPHDGSVNASGWQVVARANGTGARQS